MLLMVSATVLSKNVYKVFRQGASEGQVGRLAKLLVPVIALVGMAFTLWTSLDLVLLLLLGYDLVTQPFPPLLFSPYLTTSSSSGARGPVSSRALPS